MGLARLRTDLYFMIGLIKTKMLCKSTMKEGSRYNIRVMVEIFIEGKEYDVECKPFRKGSSGFSEYQYYWATGEDGEKREIPPSHFNIIFCNKAEKRNKLIEEILKK